MPVLRFRAERLRRVLGIESIEKVLEYLEMLKGEATVVNNEWVEVEFEVDRPDLYTVEGIARAINGLTGREKGLPTYTIVETDYTVETDYVETRPYIAAAMFKDVNIDDYFLEELIQFQEKLHQSYGMSRRRVAIGLHDADKMPSKRLYYRFENIDKVRFVPLGSTRAMTVREVLEKTEQGRKYGNISLKEGKHPILYSGDEVISLPPVINAELTRIEPGTRNVFVDVTGTDLNAVLTVLYVIAANLAERNGRVVGTVEVRGPFGRIREPQMPVKIMHTSLRRLTAYLGLDVRADEVLDAIRRMRMDASLLPDGETVEATIPAYRIDVLNWVDIAEDVAIVFQDRVLSPRKPTRMLRGGIPGFRVFERRVRTVMLGLGFSEAYTYTLTDCSFSKLFAVEGEPLKLSNPVSTETACFRSTVIQQLIRVVARSSYRIPVRVYEIGDVAYVSEGRVRYRKRIGIALADRKAGYEDIQAVVYALLRSLGLRLASVKPVKLGFGIDGRAAVVEASEGVKAFLAEVRPEILVENGIHYPTAVAEIDYTELARMHGWAAAVSRP